MAGNDSWLRKMAAAACARPGSRHRKRIHCGSKGFPAAIPSTRGRRRPNPAAAVPPAHCARSSRDDRATPGTAGPDGTPSLPYCQEHAGRLNGSAWPKRKRRVTRRRHVNQGAASLSRVQRRWALLPARCAVLRTRLIHRKPQRRFQKPRHRPPLLIPRPTSARSSSPENRFPESSGRTLRAISPGSSRPSGTSCPFGP